jgi:hypothetical protein
MTALRARAHGQDRSIERRVRAGISAVVAAGALACALCAATAQTYTAEEVRAMLAQIVPPLEREHDCAVSIHGEPRFDEFAKAWLVAYSASGSDCDEMSASLRSAGAPVEIEFFRRPTAEQLEGLIGKIKRSVAAGYSCRIDVRGPPKLDETTGLWWIQYVAAGSDCPDAEEELGRQGHAAQIAFFRVPGHR